MCGYNPAIQAARGDSKSAIPGSRLVSYGERNQPSDPTVAPASSLGA